MSLRIFFNQLILNTAEVPVPARKLNFFCQPLLFWLWNEKLTVTVCVRPELNDTKSCIYRKRAMKKKKKVWSKNCRICTDVTSCSQHAPVVGGREVLVNSKSKIKIPLPAAICLCGSGPVWAPPAECLWHQDGVF